MIALTSLVWFQQSDEFTENLRYVSSIYLVDNEDDGLVGSSEVFSFDGINKCLGILSPIIFFTLTKSLHFHLFYIQWWRCILISFCALWQYASCTYSVITFRPPYIERWFAWDCRYFSLILIPLYFLDVIINTFNNVFALVCLSHVTGTFKDAILRLIGYANRVSFIVCLDMRLQTLHKILIIKWLVEGREEDLIAKQFVIPFHYCFVVSKVNIFYAQCF